MSETVGLHVEIGAATPRRGTTTNRPKEARTVIYFRTIDAVTRRNQRLSLYPLVGLLRTSPIIQ